ncbi:MAG TPA: hypothetical protein VF116_23940 [Ktedonobacterales bacterium]
MSGATAAADSAWRRVTAELRRGTSWWSRHPLLLSACGVEAFLLGLVAVAPIGGVAQTISPLARIWPFLLLPSRLIFGPELVDSSVPPERGWPALALYAALLVGAGCVAALPLVLRARVTEHAEGAELRGGRGEEKAEIHHGGNGGNRGQSGGGAEKTRRTRSEREDREEREGGSGLRDNPAASPSPSVSSVVSSPSSGRRELWVVLGVAAALGLTLVLLPALPSDDVFSYILYGRISAIHAANPLLVTPSSFPGDPFLRLVFWQGTRSVYGPVWLLVSAALTHLAEALGGSLATYVLLYKLLGFGAHLANAALIWATLGRLAPRRQLLGTLLYAWNPLCLLEFCASAHNDALMLTFALAGVYCLVRRWEVPALIAFGLAIGVKYVLLALVPLYLMLVLRERLRRSAGEGESVRAAIVAVVWRAALVLGVVALTAAPFWAGPKTLGAILGSPPAQQLDNSLLEMAQWPLRALAQAAGMPSAAAATAVQSGLKLIGLALFVLVWLRALWRTRGLESMLRGWGWVLLAYVVVGSGWFWPWYATWIVAVAALVEWGELSVAALLLAAGATTLYAFLPLYSAGVYGVRALVAFGPALGCLLWRHRRWVRRRAIAAAGAWGTWSNRWGKARVIGGKGR